MEEEQKARNEEN